MLRWAAAIGDDQLVDKLLATNKVDITDVDGWALIVSRVNGHIHIYKKAHRLCNQPAPFISKDRKQIQS